MSRKIPFSTFDKALDDLNKLTLENGIGFSDALDIVIDRYRLQACHIDRLKHAYDSQD